MTTLQQVFKRRRKKKKHKIRSPRLNKNPQIRAVCMKISVRKPKKPNSAQRKIARVLIPR
jgi:small subunit ribosomal protein S12